MSELLLFLICFVIILIIYEIFVVLPMKRYKKGKRKSKKIKNDPVEIRYLVFKYGLDLEKVNYNRLLRIVSLVSSFDMALVVSIISLIDGYMWQMLLALVLVIPIFLFSYSLVFKYYKKKGMIKNV